ncbi:MAG: hypothetical protein HY744_16065 [Deltaproteobacteria bacterium]|nr:hypothetical protein [Deltaproteobacteria bacterium]
MTASSKASLLQELLDTADAVLVTFAQRVGLASPPDLDDLRRARELLQAIDWALQANTLAYWLRVESAWKGMQTAPEPPPPPSLMRNPAAGSAPGPAAWDRPAVAADWPGAPEGAAAQPQPACAAGPAKPAWVRSLPAKPSLGDLAPGMAPPPVQRVVPRAPVAPPPWSPPAAPAPAAPRGAPPVAPARRGLPPPRHAAVAAAPRAPQGSPPAAASAGPDGAGGRDVETDIGRYAEFCAHCAAYPDRLTAVGVRFGLRPEETRDALDELWQARFDDDPALQQHWEQLVAWYRDALARGAG